MFCRNSIFDRSIKRRNIKAEDPYDWELISQNRDANNENNETSMGYYSDNNNKVKNVYAKNVDGAGRSNNAANAVSSGNAVGSNNNFSNFHNASSPNEAKSVTNKMNNLNLNITNKDVSLVTQMNACADDLSLKPNATDIENKRNVTQYCVS